MTNNQIDQIPDSPLDPTAEPKIDRRSLTSAINGRKSRGPITPEGKAIATGNNVRHGMLARAVVLDDESTERFTALARELHQEFQPRSVVERALVDTMAIARWRQVRLWAMEKANLDHEIRRQQAETRSENDPTRAALAFRALSDNSNSLELIHRYETRCDRQFTRAVQRLLDLRARRRIDSGTPEIAPSASEK